MKLRKRATRTTVVAVLSMLAFAAMATPASADGNHVSSFDFAAATPGTYDIVTGSGGSYGDGGGANVVESLEPDDFVCNQRVVFFTLLEMDAGAPPHTLSIENEFDRESTAGVQVGYAGPVEISVVALDGTSTILGTLSSSNVVTGATALVATAVVAGLGDGEAVALRHEMSLVCNEPPPLNGGGNIHAALNSGTELLPDVGANLQGGQQDIPLKPNIPAPTATFAVDLGPCVGEVDDSSTLVTVNITPSDGGTIDIFDSEGDPVANNLADGESIDLQPGDYTWEADISPPFDPSGDTSGAFTVEDCSLEPPPPPPPPVIQTATVAVDLGACVPAEGTSPVSVEVNPDEAATITISDPDGDVVETFTNEGSVDLRPAGDFTWQAVAAQGFDLTGDTSGEITPESCVLPETIEPGERELAKTGVGIVPIGFFGVLILLSGLILRSVERRGSGSLRPVMSVAGMAVVEQAAGTVWWLRPSRSIRPPRGEPASTEHGPPQRAGP